MYQGKFDKKKKGAGVSVEDIVASRNTASKNQSPAPQAPTRRQAAPEAPVRRQSAAPEAPQKRQMPPHETPAARKAPGYPQETARKTPSYPPEVARKIPAAYGYGGVQAPAKQRAAAPEPRRKGPRLGSVIFYTLYFLFIFLFFVGVYFGLNWLNGWLGDFEAAQPTAKAEAVFQQLFTHPDWGSLYDSAGVTDTMYEGKDSFVSYMTGLVGDQALTYQETSNGLGKGAKYLVKLGDQKIAYFTMVNRNAADNTDQSTSGKVQSDLPDIPDWQLDSVGFFFERANSYRIQTEDGHIPYVNGIALSDDQVVQVSTVKEDTSGFLPAYPNAPKTSIYEISNLLSQPTITVTDAAGGQREVTYDSSTGMYVETADAISMPDDLRNLALEALKVYARYGIKEATGAEVGKYFDSTGAAYKSIMQTVLTWTKGNNGISFDKDSVTNYCRYSDTMFSAYVTSELTIRLTDGGTQVKSINSTLLFSKQGGSWKVIKMTNANLPETVGKVRLTFMNDGTVLSNDFYDMEATTLATPLLSVPAGKVFSGWATETVKEDGSKTMTLVFEPDANGDVTIPDDRTLTPMVLYPLFENA